MEKPNLEKIITSKVRAEILRLFLLSPDRELSIHMRGIARKIKYEVNGIRRELNNLVELEILKATENGVKIQYQVNWENELTNVLYNLIKVSA